LQWHHDNEDDPVYCSLAKIFVDDIQLIFEEMQKRGTIQKTNSD